MKERRGRGNPALSALPIDSTPRAKTPPSSSSSATIEADPDATPRPARPPQKKPAATVVSPGKLIRQGSMDFLGVEAPDLSSARSLSSKLASLDTPRPTGGDRIEDVEMDDVTTALSTSLLSSTPKPSSHSPRRSLASSLALGEARASLSPEKPATETPPKPSLAKRGRLVFGEQDVTMDDPPSPSTHVGAKRASASTGLAPPATTAAKGESSLASPFDEEAGALSPSRSLVGGTVAGPSSKKRGAAGGSGSLGRGKRVRRS